MTPRTLLFALALILATAFPALADGLIVIWDPPVPRPRQPHVFAPLHVKEHHVEVSIRDQVATTTVRQVFHNPSDQRLEGTYIFPIPVGAVMDRFAMEIDGKEMDAELLDAEKARSIYEEIVRKSRDPALMEYAGQGLFRVRIFPIEPRSDKRVTLKYTQVLKRDQKMVDYVYPLNTEKFSSLPIESLSLKVELEAGQPLGKIYSPTHEVEITRRVERKAVVGFEGKDVRPDTDFQLFFTTQTDAMGLSLLAYNQPSLSGSDNDGGFAMLLLTPGSLARKDRVIPKDIVFVLDTSGSMSGGKLDQAQKALLFCIDNLNDGDRFEVVRFSTEAEPLFGKLTPIDHQNRDLAHQFVDGLKPNGGTAIEDALLTALRSFADRDEARPAIVIFLTDGMPTVGNTNEDAIVQSVAEKAGKTRVFCFGVGTDVNTHLLDKITEKTRAYSQYVLPDEDIEVKLSRFYDRIDAPVLANLSLNVTGGPRLTKMQPAELPDLFDGDQLVLLTRYTGSGDATITLTGDVNGEKQAFEFNADFPGAGEAKEHDFIPRLWASRRVGYLLEQIRLHGESAELKQEVTELARAYGIVTPYTSHLILEDEEQRNVPMAMQTLRDIQGNEMAKAAAEQGYNDFESERSGEAAVRGSRSLGGYKAADSLAGASAAKANADAPMIAASAQPGGPLNEQAEAAARVVQQQSKFVRGRSFYKNGETWVDSGVQTQKDAKVVDVAFGSDDYFALLRRHPDIPAWLSVGPDVQVLIDGVVYQVK